MRREKARKEGGGRRREEEGGRTIKSPSSFSLSVPLSIALLAKGQKMSSPSVVAREEREREKGTRRVRQKGGMFGQAAPASDMSQCDTSLG